MGSGGGGGAGLPKQCMCIDMVYTDDTPGGQAGCNHVHCVQCCFRYGKRAIHGRCPGGGRSQCKGAKTCTSHLGGSHWSGSHKAG